MQGQIDRAESCAVNVRIDFLPGPVNQHSNTLYDALGRNTKDIINERIHKGSHTVFFDRAGLPAGVYFLQCRTDTRNEVAKTVIINK